MEVFERKRSKGIKIFWKREMKLKDWIIYEDDNYIVLNKPAGLLSIPDREGKEISLKKILAEKFEQIFTVHRLDKDTSGLIIFAKNESTHKSLSLQFEERQTKKIYRGLVLGVPSVKKGSIDSPIAEHPVKKGIMMVNRKGKSSLTDFEVLQEFKRYSLLEFQIYTGRTHQIRVHSKEIGHPIVCDELYGDGKPILLSSLKHRFKLSKNELEEKPLLNRLALHAFSLSFTDNLGKKVYFEAPLPRDLRATIQQLEKINAKS